MRYQDEQFDSNGGPRSGDGPFADTRRLAQLVLAARAARQLRESAGATREGERERLPTAQAKPISILPGSDRFTAAAYGPGNAVVGGSVPPDGVPTKVFTIQSLRQSQRPQITNAGRDAGNFIRVGQRPLLPGYPADRWYHTYLEIPRFENGRFTGQFDNYGILGEWDKNKREGTSHNQQVIENDPTQRNGPKKDSNRNQTYEVPVSPEQREALRKGAKHWSDWKNTGEQCPSCGSRYVRGGPFSNPAYNSNTWVYNMLIHNPAGRIEPPAAINKKDAPGWAVNDVGRNYYPD